MSDTQQVVLSIIGNYTQADIIGPKSKLGADLRIGPLDAESIRLDLEDEFNIEIPRSDAMQWKRCKQILASVKRQFHR